MSQTAGPSSRGAASTSAVGSSSNLARAATEATEGPNREEATAIVKLHSFFHRGGTAYTLNDKAVSRYYCKACLEHEIGVVRAAREQYGQGTNATDDVLRNIGERYQTLCNVDVYANRLFSNGSDGILHAQSANTERAPKRLQVLVEGGAQAIQQCQGTLIRAQRQEE
jgi:hypothetical protein